ncbi:uncharacterized protein LOC125775575 [Bactrocera dorsalis]|uniref:Uncharacterized protein LOC125775575 n=1 Tax=Bactrocera dorsalis TaxID=27457 RepID=A0ABM3IYX8_BACDO|nr:uncharacterized protein LOC125775575 [Bactrocera dorsalis]
MRRNKVSISGTGGGPPSHCTLTPLEEQVSELLAMEISVSGISGTSEFGAAQLTQPSGSDITTDEFRQNEQTPVDERPHCSQQRVAPQKKDSLLNKQVDNRIAYHKGSLKVLSEINENLKILFSFSFVSVSNVNYTGDFSTGKQCNTIYNAKVLRSTATQFTFATHCYS